MTIERLYPWSPLKRWIGSLVVGVGLMLHGPPPQDTAPLFVYDFDLGPSPTANVDYVRSLGFEGLVTRCRSVSDLPKLASYADHVEDLEGFGLLVFVAYDFSNPESPQVWRDALPILKSMEAPLWVIVRNAPSSADVDDLLLEMAQGAEAHGVPAVIYPHWDTDIEDAADAAASMARVGHPNLFSSLHTCHEIRSGNQYQMEAVVGTHVDRTRLVTIAGADDHAYTGPPPREWDDAIKPLDRGGYDLTPFLRALDRRGYDGPIVLHTWGLADDPGHLERSLRAYAEIRAGL